MCTYPSQKDLDFELIIYIRFRIESRNQIYRYFSSRLLIINLAVLYNLIIVIGRSVFWDLQNLLPTGWLVLDYSSDFLYILDIIVRYVFAPIILIILLYEIFLGLMRDFWSRG